MDNKATKPPDDLWILSHNHNGKIQITYANTGYESKTNYQELEAGIKRFVYEATSWHDARINLEREMRAYFRRMTFKELLKLWFTKKVDNGQ